MGDQTAQLVFDAKAELAEGPVWHEGALWWVNINAGTLHRLDTATGVSTSRTTGDFLGAAVPAEPGNWLIARRNEIARIHWLTGKITPLAALPAGDPRLRFNDGKCDPRGRFFVGTMHRDIVQGSAAFYRLENNRLIPEFNGVTISNGLDWSPDAARFYYTDTLASRIDVFDCDLESGAIQNRRPLVTIPPERGYPDGLCCDVNGNLWVALWGGGCVECFDGRTGKSMERISVPTRQVSSCCFGGANLDWLFITTAWEGYDAAAREAEPLAGGIFGFQPGIRGQPVSKFNPDPTPLP
jgi:sugar lactone lactonase YvrE